MTIYDEPYYYEIAFSFINPKKQLKLFEDFINRYSKIKVNSILDIGCGPSLQLIEIAKKKYEVIGLDINKGMLKYLKHKAKEEKIKIKTIKANMVNFKLKNKVDFAFIMMGTIGYVRNNDEFLKHLDSVACSLNKGGLYLIENFTIDWANIKSYKPTSWIMRRNKTKIKTAYKVELRDILNQKIMETIKVSVDDHGKKMTLQEKRERNLIFPQEFLMLLKVNNKFEFLGWFERNKIRPLTKARGDNIALLRRK